MDSQAIEVSLVNGSLLASVDPKREGPKFEVVTEHMQARVTGTIFFISTGKEGESIKVLRGKVETTDNNGVKRRVLAGYAYNIGELRTRTVSVANLRRLQEGVDDLEKRINADELLLDLSTSFDFAKSDDARVTPHQTGPSNTLQKQNGMWPKTTRIYKRHLRSH